MTTFCFGYGRSANRIHPRRWQSSGSDLVMGPYVGPICGARAESSQHHLRVAWEDMAWIERPETERTGSLEPLLIFFMLMPDKL